MLSSCFRPALVAFVLLAAPLLLPVAAHAENWALLIGIDRYNDGRIATLGAASADATALAQTLQEVGGFAPDHVRVLVSDGERKPTRSNILEELVRLGKNAQPGDTVFVMYSGHGEEVAGVPYLIPYDATAADNETLTESSLSVATFRKKLAQIKARALILAFDMCRTNPLVSGRDVVAGDNRLSPTMARGLDFSKSKGAISDTPAAESPITVTLYSCSPNERSYEWAEKKRGYFSYFLERGLRGDAGNAAGSVTLLGLAKYVEAQTAATVRREEQKNQTPFPSLEGPGADAFVLVQGAERLTETTVSGKRKDTKARLNVQVNVPNATVSVEKKSAENNRFDFNLLDEKQRNIEVKVTAPGYEGQLITVEVVRGQTLNMPVALEPLPYTANELSTTTAEPPQGFWSGKAIQGTEADADMAVAQKDYARAIGIYTGLIQAVPRKFTTYLKRGNALYETERYDYAVFDYSQFIILRPALAQGYLNRAYAYNKLGKRNEGLADLAKVELLDPSILNAKLKADFLNGKNGIPVNLVSGTGPGANGNGSGKVPGSNGKGSTGTGSGYFGIKGGAGTVTNINKTATGTGVGNTGVTIEARGGNVVTTKTLARATRSPRPRITEEMKAAAKRPAEVEFTIGANGSASFKLARSSGDPDVDAAVLAACSGYRWMAATVNGTPVETKQIVNFDPNQ